MGFLTKFFNFYIYSNLHVSFAVFCLTKITLLQFGITENVSSLFVFFATIISYNAIRFINIGKIRNESVVFIRSYKLQLLILNIICLFMLAFTAFLLRFRALLMLFPFVILIFVSRKTSIFHYTNDTYQCHMICHLLFICRIAI